MLHFINKLREVEMALSTTRRHCLILISSITLLILLSCPLPLIASPLEDAYADFKRSCGAEKKLLTSFTHMEKTFEKRMEHFTKQPDPDSSEDKAELLLSLGKVFWPYSLPDTYPGKSLYTRCYQEFNMLISILRGEALDSMPMYFSRWKSCLLYDYGNHLQGVTKEAVDCFEEFLGK